MTNRPGGAARRWTAGATAVAAVATGGWLVRAGLQTSGPPAPPPAVAAQVDPVASATGRAAPGLPYSRPVRIRVPGIGVDARVVPVGLDADQNLDVPTGTTAGWYDQSATPGSTGNAVIDGHVDTLTGPAVFYLLGRVRAGDTVSVTRADGRTAVFQVDAVRLYPRDAVPAAQVFGPADRPQLRLLTCGGRYSHATGYQGTVVVFAHLR